MYDEIILIGPLYIEFLKNDYDWISCIGGDIGNISILLFNINFKRFVCISKIGNDYFGENIINIFKDYKINYNYIQKDTTLNTYVNFINQNLEDIFNYKMAYPYDTLCISNTINKKIIYVSIESLYSIENINKIIYLSKNNLIIFDIYKINNIYIYLINYIINNLLPIINILIGLNINYNKISNNISFLKKKIKNLYFLIFIFENKYYFITNEFNFSFDKQNHIYNKWTNNILISCCLAYLINNNLLINKQYINIIHISKLFEYINSNLKVQMKLN